MESSAWDERFATGIGAIDGVRRHLAGLVDRFGGQMRQAGEEAALEAAFAALTDAVRCSFADEERLLGEAGADPRQVETHAAHHRLLVLQLESLWGSRPALHEPAQAVPALLAAWLDFHFVGEDQTMAQQLAQAEAAQQQLLQTEKMAAIGQLAAGVAHEINNPVGFVHSNLSTLKGYVNQLLAFIDVQAAYLPSMGPEREAVEAARRSTDLDFLREDLPALLKESEDGLARVIRIVQDLKGFSHVNSVEFLPADLNAGMESTLNVVWSEIKYKAEVVREYGDIPPVVCVAAQINQVFMNLLVNAAHAIPLHGTITVRSGQDGGEVWVEVRDTGKGMTPDVQKRIFEPFFTTKPAGKGTGLGLSLSYDIVVKKHGGRLEVVSEPGAGSTFRIILPVQAAPPAAGQ